MLTAVVERFIKCEFNLSSPVSSILPVDPDVARQNKDYVTEYGQPLVNLSNEAWNSSYAHWMGKHWDIIIDLCTQQKKALAIWC